MGCSADGWEWIENLCQSGAHFLNWDDWDCGMTLGINVRVDFVINAGIEIKIVSN